MGVMRDHLLQMAGRGWRLFPLHGVVDGRCTCGKDCGRDAGKHPRTRHGVKDASTDPTQIAKWAQRWPDTNWGIATGQGLVVLDLDSVKQVQTMQAIAAPHGGLPESPVVQTGRGFHVYMAGEVTGSKTVEGLLIRGEGGYVVAPGSTHISGAKYQWLKQVALPPLPDWFKIWLNSSTRLENTLGLGPKPAYLQDIKTSISWAPKAVWNQQEVDRIESALAAIPASCNRETWLRIGMSLHDTSPEQGFAIWDAWSATCIEKYSLHDVETRWASFGKPGRGGITLGSLYHEATQRGWTGNLPREVIPETSAVFEKVNGVHAGPVLLPTAFVQKNSESPLIELNEKYAVIGDIGSKCLVMGWVPSKIDNGLAVPSFQNFQAFTQRFANRYVEQRKPKGDEWVTELQQLGATWLKWGKRRTFEGIDLVPGGDHILPGNLLNLWNGFGVEPKEGEWPLMKAHIANVLANGNVEAMQYIMRWTAWTVQNPGERAEAALVFRGGKGSGKGIFANALRSIFGSHGLSVSNSKHLVGAFNGHLRNCLLLFADEAFWAGDKQGESVLKAILTEPLLTIEQKGIDAAPWKNRLHCIMAANNEWVIPASHDERRFAMFDVSNERIGDESYFRELHREMKEGGLAAMLHDLLALDLKGWHPRRVPATEALQSQKQRSLDVLHDWFEGLLQDGMLPAIGAKGDPLNLPAAHLLHTAKEVSPKLRDVSGTAMGRFLRKMGCIKMRNATHNSWKFPQLAEARARWVQQYGRWTWEANVGEWQSRN